MKRVLTLFCLIALVFALGACSSSAAGAAEPAGNMADDPAPDKDISQGIEDMDMPSIDDGSLRFDDFDFYESLLIDGIPSDAYYPSLKYAEGTWKYDLRIRYDSDDGYQFDEIGYADLALDYDREVVIITLHPRMAQDGYEAYEEDDSVGYEPFEGGFDDDGNLKMIGNDCVLYITQYYDYGGQEFILGTIWFSEESFGDFIMVRGQN